MIIAATWGFVVQRFQRGSCGQGGRGHAVPGGDPRAAAAQPAPHLQPNRKPTALSTVDNKKETERSQSALPDHAHSSPS